jgi:SAM-dependent methyltransferase
MTKIGYEKSAEFYDFFDKKDNIDFFCSYALRVGEALDIGAGTGRISIPILEKGIKTWCVEPSPEMLEQLIYKLDEKPELGKLSELVRADASTFKFERKFKFAFMSGVFDHFLNNEEREKALLNIYDNLENDGLLVFDVFIGLMKDSSLKPAGTHKIDSKEIQRFVSSKIMEDETIKVTLIFKIYENNELLEKIEQISYAAIINKKKAIDEVEKAGFKILNLYGDYDFSPFEEDGELLIIEAKKPNKD